MSRKRIRGSSRQKPSITDEIPLAFRSYTSTPKAQSRPLATLLKFTLLLLIGPTIGFLLLMGPLRGLIQPPPVAGLSAKLSADGRLLGHFPYPEAKSSQLTAVLPGYQLRPEASQSFLAMQQAAAADGVALTLLSAYRSVASQRELFFDVKAQRNQTSLDRAKVSAPPGFSEHSTGYAIDVGDGGEPQTNLSTTFTRTKAFRWLQRNAPRFQFTLSFPHDNAQGVSFEPWHWRFEGSTESLHIFEPANRLQQAKQP